VFHDHRKQLLYIVYIWDGLKVLTINEILCYRHLNPKSILEVASWKKKGGCSLDGAVSVCCSGNYEACFA